LISVIAVTLAAFSAAARPEPSQRGPSALDGPRAEAPEVDVTLPERPDPNPPKAEAGAARDDAQGAPAISLPPARLHAGGAGGAVLSDPSSIEPLLDGYVAGAMADQYPPGMMVAVATRDRVFVKAFGLADAEKNVRATNETLFRIASISKTFVWTAVMILVDEGKLDLDADVDSYLKKAKVGQRGMKPVTLRDLMAHRAGFEDAFGVFFQSGTGRTFEEALARTRPARVAVPGDRTAYSNWGASLAAQIVADVSGMAFDEFVAERLLQPLGMTSTVQHDPASVGGVERNPKALDERLASPHKIDAGGTAVMPHDRLDPLYAAGAFALDANDAGRWVQFLLNGGLAGDQRPVSPEAFARMRKRAFKDRPFAPDFAHGFMETEIGGAITFGHGGTLSGFISDMTIAPSLGVGVFVVVNGAESPRLPDLVSRFVIEQFARADSFPRAWSMTATPQMIEKARSAAGAYLPNRRVYSRFEKVAALGSEIRLAAKDDGSLIVTAGGKATRYYPVSDDLWSDRSRDRLFVYRDAAGAPVRIATAMGTMTADRVSFFQSSTAFSAGIGGAALVSALALLGAWRRQGRDVATTRLGIWLAGGHAAAALLWIAFVVALTAASVALSSKTLADFQAEGWPPTGLVIAMIAAHLAALGAAIAAVGVLPVLAGSGWSIWRKGHYLLFAAAGLFAVWQLAVWRMIFAAPSGG
jgi:CubicO group peptidase (beta-lactamase class C family)